MIKRRAITLSVEGPELPTEFRLFTAGWNDTENGRFLFDEAAAHAVMSAHQAWGVDVAIDLEHNMVNLQGPSADPTARDARGWCRLQLRGGELWAYDVRWTPDGAERLSQKRQRYISPAFEIDKAKRITKIINIAITALPATHKTPALVAASVGGKMDSKLVMQALEALTNGDAEAAMEILKGLIASAAAGEASEETVVAPAEEKPVEEASAPAADPEKKEEDEKMMAAARVALAITGKKDPGEAMAELSRRSAVAVDLEKREAQLAKDRAALESSERRTLVGQLVKLGVEIPATAWSDDKGSVPCERLAKEPIEELRNRVQKLSAAKQKPSKVEPPAGDGARSFQTTRGVITLSQSELAECERVGAKPEKYAELKALRQPITGK